MIVKWNILASHYPNPPDGQPQRFFYDHEVVTMVVVDINHATLLSLSLTSKMLLKSFDF